MKLAEEIDVSMNAARARHAPAGRYRSARGSVDQTQKKRRKVRAKGLGPTRQERSSHRGVSSKIQARLKHCIEQLYSQRGQKSQMPNAFLRRLFVTSRHMRQSGPPTRQGAYLAMATRVLWRLGHRAISKDERGLAWNKTLDRTMAWLAQNSEHWVRPLDGWRPMSTDLKLICHDLVRHLLGAYEIPTWMVKQSVEGDGPNVALAQAALLHVGRGGNLRTSPKLPFALTKRMAHFALRAPEDCSLGEALRWGHVLALGADAELARQVRQSRVACLYRDRQLHQVVEDVVRYLVRHRSIPVDQFGFIAHYVAGTRLGFVGDYGAEPQRIKPIQPGLRLTRRSPTTLLRQARKWCEDLEKGEGLPLATSWPSATFNGLDPHVEHAEHGRGWQLTELRTVGALFEEGQAMDHCVGSYGRDCWTRKCSIWSLKKWKGHQYVRALTIEIRDNEVETALGHANRDPKTEERKVLVAWAKREGLTANLSDSR